MAAEITNVFRQSEHLMSPEPASSLFSGPHGASSPKESVLSPGSSTMDMDAEARARRRTQLLAALPRELVQMRHLGCTLGTFLDKNWQTLMFPADLERAAKNPSNPGNKSILSTVAGTDRPLLATLRQRQLSWRDEEIKATTHVRQVCVDGKRSICT